jgi:hypothetical protein
MSNDDDCSPSLRQRNIHLPEIFEKAAHSYKDNDVCFSTMEPIDARYFNVSEVREAAFQELDLTAANLD